jgi:hypothetical protein
VADLNKSSQTQNTRRYTIRVSIDIEVEQPNEAAAKWSAEAAVFTAFNNARQSLLERDVLGPARFQRVCQDSEVIE